MHFNFIDVILLYYGHQHVSANSPAIFRVISLRTRIQLWLQLSESLNNCKNSIIMWFIKRLFPYSDKFVSTESVQKVEWRYHTVTMNTGVGIWTEGPLVKARLSVQKYKAWNVYFEKLLYQYITEMLQCYWHLCVAFNNYPKAQKSPLHLSLLCKLQTSWLTLCISCR